MAERNYTGEIESEPRLDESGGLRPKPASAPTSAAVNDQQLLDRAVAGDGKAFHAVVDRHLDRLFRLASSMLGNASDAEDVLQEALAGAYRGIGKFERRASVGTWLTRILVTQVARWRRDKYRRRDTTPLTAMSLGGSEADNDESGGSFAVSDGGEAGTDAKLDVQTALARLSPMHREVIVLREFEKLSYEEIADMLGVPQGTVESRLHRARAELKQLLSSYLP